MGKINIGLDEATHKAVKIRAIEEGVDMKDWVAETLRKAVDKKGLEEEE